MLKYKMCTKICIETIYCTLNEKKQKMQQDNFRYIKKLYRI